jgi:deoxyhypusine synthase
MVIRRPRTATIVLGGGTPKNFINQAACRRVFQRSVGGHKYALQIVTDVPHFGGASGSTLKRRRAGASSPPMRPGHRARDATIALPLLVTRWRTAPGPAQTGNARISIQRREMLVEAPLFPRRLRGERSLTR